MELVVVLIFSRGRCGNGGGVDVHFDVRLHLHLHLHLRRHQNSTARFFKATAQPTGNPFRVFVQRPRTTTVQLHLVGSITAPMFLLPVRAVYVIFPDSPYPPMPMPMTTGLPTASGR